MIERNQAGSGLTGKILIVDDNLAGLRLLMNMLRKHGYVVHPAGGGKAALRFVQSVLPDLILLDVMMPGMDGYQLCELLKADERTRDIPVIFISSADQVLNKVRAFAIGGVDYIVRPLQVEEVLARIQTHLSLRNFQKHLEYLVREQTRELLESNAKLQEENAERKLAEERIRFMVHHDALTGLPNRILLQDRTKQSLAQAHRNRTTLAILFIDLDNFKQINDLFGHQIGDRLLQQVAYRLRECVREGDSVARFGGDEFVLSLVTGNGDESLVARKVLDALQEPFIIDGHELHAGASIGISIYPDHGNDVDTLMRAADAAMYHAKEKGRDNYQFFTPALKDTARQRFELENRLRHALAQNEFAMHYQPQVDIESGAILSAEALLRWQRSLGEKPISCGEFIAIAEETGLIIPIGEWVLREACKQLKSWRNAGYPDLRIAVNLSPRQFSQRDFVKKIEYTLDEFDLPADALNLEITESFLLTYSEHNMSILEKLSSMGIQLSMDDFGTGYSSLAYLQRFPIDSLKIDQSFVRGIGRNANDMALIIAIIAMANSLHLKVLAEGVETAQQAAFLKEHGCMAMQGFYYGEAVPAEVFSRMLYGRDSHAS